jgi:heptosyltransferase-1
MKIAIVRLSALGDIVHSMVILQFIKKHYPDSVVDWFVEKRFKRIIDNNPHINQIHQVSLKSAKESKSFFLFWKELRKIRKLGNYNLVIDMQGLIKSALVARMIPSDMTLGFDKDSLRESLASIFYDQKYKIDYAENVIERNLTLVSYALKFSFNQEDICHKQSFLYSSQKYTFNDISNTKQNIALIVGASYPSKCYPIEKFAELTTRLDANFLIIWGNTKEKVIAHKIKALSDQVCVCSKLSLDNLISMISQVDLVIGPDTGPTHMAWALNVPSITLFGPTPGYRNTYITNINKIIESDSTVNPRKINRSDYSIKNIKVSDILKLAQKLLGKVNK